ncbi:MAG: S8 family serine peptidase, partial [Nanoarchaeota archaeon]
EEFQLKRESEWGVFFSGNITEKGFYKLLKDQRVKKIQDNSIKAHLNLQESRPLINADDVYNLGYSGAGQTICIIDSGVNYNYSDLGGCFGAGCRVKAGYDYFNNDSDPFDDDGHGTFVAEIAASEDSIFTGIAPDLDIVALKVCGGVGEGCPLDDIKSALQWCYANRFNYDISIVSISLGISNGAGSCGEDFVNDEIDDLYNAGIPVITASGNDDDEEEIDYPACYSNTIAVGATYDFGDGTEELDWCDEVYGGNLIFGICFEGVIPHTEFSCTDYPEVDNIACFTNRGTLLDLLAPGSDITSLEFSGSGTSAATPMVSGVIALMLEKDSDLTPNEILDILKDTGVSIDGWKRIDALAAINEICSCTDWTAGSCGSGTCNPDERKYTRTCIDDCDTETKCQYDHSCETGGPGGAEDCTPDSCPYGYDDEGVNCYWEGNHWTCERECHRDESCGTYSGWQYADGEYTVDHNDDNTWFYSDEVSTDTFHCYDFYSYSILWVTDWDPGGILYNDAESLRIYAKNVWDEYSDCSDDQTSPVSVQTPTHSLEPGTGLSYSSSAKFNPYQSEYCSGDTAYGIEGTLLTELRYRYASYTTEDTVYEYCDVPYTSDIDLDSPIYSAENSECYVEVTGDESHPDEIGIKWYVNDDRIYDEDCDDSGADECDDDTGYTWSHIFYLDDSYYEVGDDVYCVGRGYGEDGGYGEYDPSNTVEVNGYSNGHSCTNNSDCQSDFCDNDDVGLGDDDWCFTPYNTYFDGQETSYCEYSTTYGVAECDERQVDDNLSSCTIGGESYFADECSWGCFGIDRDNICRSTDFAVGCTADSECNNVVAGTGNCDSSCNYVPTNLLFNLSEQYQNNTVSVFKFVINDTIGSSDNFTWQFDTGEGLGNSTFNSTYDIALATNESIFVYIAHDYISSGNYTVTATAYSGESSDSQNINVIII